MAGWNTMSKQFKVSAIWREECVSLLFVRTSDKSGVEWTACSLRAALTSFKSTRF